MGKIISKLSVSPIYTFLYGLAFLAFKTSAYFGNFELKTALAFVISFSLLNYLLNSIIKRIIGSYNSAFLSLLIWISIFHVVGIAQIMGYPYAYIPLTFYLLFYCFTSAIIIIVGFILKRNNYPSILNKILNVFLGISILVFFLNGIRSWINTSQETIQHQHEIVPKLINNHREIVWILMDEYGSSESLKKQMGFQNPMDSLLSERGFQVFNHAKSRFNNTLFSVYSIFNIDDSIKPSSYYEGIDLLRNSRLVPTLEKEGYRFVNLGFFDISGHEMLADRSGYPYGYLQQIISGTLMGMIHKNWKNSIVKCDAYNQEVLKKLDDSLSLKTHQNRFIWAHITIPHEPFCRDSMGNLQKEQSYGANDSNYIKQQYLSYLKYGNKRIIQLLDKHPDYKEKIIIISGDHGPRYPFLNNKLRQLSPFLAVYSPSNYQNFNTQDSVLLSSIPKIFLDL